MIVRKATSEDSAKLLELIELKAEFDRAMKGFTGEISTTIGKIESTLFGRVPYA
ncbi:GNAT family N-acetyltransferase, partial [Vibrio cionasavignyae]